MIEEKTFSQSQSSAAAAAFLLLIGRSGPDGSGKVT